MFGSGGAWRNSSTWTGWLTDLCALVLVIKGVCCILLWVGKYTCCPKCFQMEAQSIAGANTGV